MTENVLLRRFQAAPGLNVGFGRACPKDPGVRNSRTAKTRSASGHLSGQTATAAASQLFCAKVGPRTPMTENVLLRRFQAVPGLNLGFV